MSNFIPFNRDQAFLLPPDLRSWLPADDVAHFIVAAVERVPLGAFAVPTRTGGKPQYHPRLMLALLIHCYANGRWCTDRKTGRCLLIGLDALDALQKQRVATPPHSEGPSSDHQLAHL